MALELRGLPSTVRITWDYARGLLLQLTSHRTDCVICYRHAFYCFRESPMTRAHGGIEEIRGVSIFYSGSQQRNVTTPPLHLGGFQNAALPAPPVTPQPSSLASHSAPSECGPECYSSNLKFHHLSWVKPPSIWSHQIPCVQNTLPCANPTLLQVEQNTGLWPPSTHLLQLWWDLWVGATPPCGCERGRILCPGHPYVSRAQPGASGVLHSLFRVDGRVEVGRYGQKAWFMNEKKSAIFIDKYLLCGHWIKTWITSWLRQKLSTSSTALSLWCLERCLVLSKC